MKTIILARIGGLSYKIRVEIEENYVTSVDKVWVSTKEGMFETDMSQEEKQEFFEYYEDQLNEAYQEHLEDIKEQAFEDEWERRHGR